MQARSTSDHNSYFTYSTLNKISRHQVEIPGLKLDEIKSRSAVYLPYRAIII